MPIKAKQLDTGDTANKVVALDSSAKLPAVNGELLTALPALNTHSDVSATSPSAGQVLTWNNAGHWEPDDAAAAAGGLVYKGSYDVASSGTAGLANAVKGDFYIASTEGSLSGLLVRKGDHIVVNADMGGAFNKLKIDLVDNTGPYQEYIGLSQSTAITAKVGHFYTFNSSVNTSTELILPNSADLTTGDTFKVINNSTTQNDGTVTVTITGGSGKPGLRSNNPVQSIYIGPGTATSVDIEVKGQALTFIYDQSTNLFYLETGTRFLEALVDVDTTTNSPSSGDFLKYDGTNWIPETPAFLSDITSESLGDLSDVAASAPSDGDVLQYSSSSSSWSAQPASSGASRPTVTLKSGTSVTISAPSSSDLEHIYYFTSGSAVSVTLPSASGITGYKLNLKRTGTGTVSIAANGTETIDDSTASISLATQYDSYTLVSNGSGWFIL